MSFLNGGMTQNRIRELRKSRNMTIEGLAEAVEMSASHISRLETGERELMPQIAEKIATALGSTPGQVFGYSDKSDIAVREQPAAFAEDFLPYEPAPDDPLALFRSPSRYLFELNSNALEKAGYLVGDVVVVDESPAACLNPPALAAVRVRWHPAEDFMQPKTLLLQFVPPRLLITNRRGGANHVLDMDEDDAHVVGVIVSSHRRARG